VSGLGEICRGYNIVARERALRADLVFGHIGENEIVENTGIRPSLARENDRRLARVAVDRPLDDGRWIDLGSPTHMHVRRPARVWQLDLSV